MILATNNSNNAINVYKNQTTPVTSTATKTANKTATTEAQDRVTLNSGTADPTYTTEINKRSVKVNALAVSAAPSATASSGKVTGGANTELARIASAADATQLVTTVKNAGGGILRIQINHDQLNDQKQIDKVNALLNAGDKNGIRIQVTLRDDANGGGGTVLSGDKLTSASNDIKKIVSKFSAHDSFWLDTFNEGGTSASQGWADMESTLIKSARDAGYKGSIVVEDSNWAGGLTAGPESGLVKYSAQLNAANGKNSPALIGSVHEYANDADASKRLTSELKALKAAGYKLQIGEVGNANWLGGDKFEHRDAATKAVQDNMDILRAEGASVLPWMDQFESNGSMRHDVGLKSTDQYR